MNGGGDPEPPLLGSIPRKTPSATQSGNGSDGSEPSGTAGPVSHSFSATTVEDARLRQFKKPRHKLPIRTSPPSMDRPLTVQTEPEPSPTAHAAASTAAASESPPAPSRHPWHRHKSDTIRTVSEAPLVLRIRTAGLALAGGAGIPRQRASARAPKRKVVSYREDGLNDDDLLMTDTEDEGDGGGGGAGRPPNKRRRLAPVVVGSPTTGMILDENGATDEGAVAAPLDKAGMIIDSPPPGVLSTLWYSRENFLNIFVLERIHSWKTRVSLSLVNEQDDPVELPTNEAVLLQSRLLADEQFFSDQMRRLEVSRLAPSKCPLILAIAAEQAKVAAEADGVTPKYKLKPGPREEILLVKWRGRSHLHCSWERASDLIRLDVSNNNTAKNKIRRYYQNQEAVLGFEWKKVMEEERNLATTIHTHGTATAEEEEVASDDFFSPQCLEVERIMMCDETEMNMEVLAKQRTLNLRSYREPDQSLDLASHVHDDQIVDSALIETDKATRGIRKTARSLLSIASTESPWDPEDNVRYIVKWKGLPYSEMTWEYWRDIKRDAVDEAEDFWYRQRPPNPDEAIEISNRPHPNIRDFRKLDGTQTYGKSSRERPVVDGQKAAINDDEDDEPGSGFRLRSYQLEGVNWLLFNWWNRRSCILADEMGLGKTIQSAAFLQELQTQPASQIRGPFLIVAPLSLIGQWESELKSWAPDLNLVLYHGSADARDFLAQNEFFYSEPFVPKHDAIRLRRNFITKFHVLITTYEVILKDIGVLSKIKWKTLIVDEAHRLKNSKAKLFEELACVPRDYCVLLTGTPIANATEELWALLHFANPSTFADKDDFLDKFGQMTEAKQVNALHSLLKPYLLRRVKEDVEKSLPPKEETILEVSLTPIQKTFYKAIYERNTAFLYKGAKPNNAPSLNNIMMELRKCCNHPYLVKGAEDRIVNEAAARLMDKKDEHGNPVCIDQGKLFGEQLIKSSGKMVLLEKLLQKLFVDGHKVLIFSQMVRVLDLIEELLKMKSFRYERLDGSTSSSSRSHAVDRFNRKSLKRFVMLLSTRAGGLGLNLTAADIVIIYDSDWNPQNDLQAMARAHRIGQTRAVQVFRLLTAKTYEMHMFHTASLKLGLERAVLSQNREQAGGEESDNDNKAKKKADREQQAKEIDELLKKGAYDVFRDEDDKEAEMFMETDIDLLLENSSKKVVYGEAATSSLGSGLGSFSKASFVASTTEGEKDVDLDDPDFWSKAVGLEVPADTPEEIAQMIDDGVKRSRKQVQVYDPYAEVAEAEQMRKDKLALERLMEKEEKERIKLEKKMKVQEQKAKKKRELEEQAKKLQADKAGVKVPTLSKEVIKMNKAQAPPVDPKPKKSKKSDRQRAIKRAENEDPVIERLKQGWEVPQRTKATAAALRFGFNRFCKLRNESNLTSLPLHDLEIFIRCYIYQLGLQAAFMFLTRVPGDVDLVHIRELLQEWIGIRSVVELDWLTESIRDAMIMYADVVNHRKLLRMPAILAEPSYVGILHNGAAFRALRRFGVLARLNSFIEDCIDSILCSLGHEELGKRGCVSQELASLDVDLKSRFVSNEELSLAISQHLRFIRVAEPASWWDRSCDIGLLIGSFVHGLGNYESMRNDWFLPFAVKLRRLAHQDEACRSATDCFRAAAAATRQTFDDALESARIKAELEVQAAVAAAAKTASQREEDAANLRKGGAEAEAAAKNMPETQVENAFEYDGTDSHFVTLPRIRSNIIEAIRRDFASAAHLEIESGPPEPKTEETMDGDTDEVSPGRIRDHQRCPLPDARVLDNRLLLLLKSLEESNGAFKNILFEDPNPDLWYKSDDCLTNILVCNEILPLFVDNSNEQCSGTGIGANQCGTSHRTLNDGCDYGFGSASPQLSQVAYGTDAPRYLRAIGVPMNISRFAISAMIYAESSVINSVIEDERLRFIGNQFSQNGTKPATPEPADQSSDEPEETPASLRNTNQMKTKSLDRPVDEPMRSANETSDNGDNSKLRSSLMDGIPLEFRLNAKLRATVCMAVLFFGYPDTDDQSLIGQEWCAFDSAPKDPSKNNKTISMFSGIAFRDAITKLSPDLDVPVPEMLRLYIESFLLPCCFRLCVNGNGPTTRSARGSEGKYETAYGISLQPEPTALYPSPLPDPCMNLQEQSLEAVGYANAILRRVRLLRACQGLCAGGQSALETLRHSVQSSALSSIDDMPVWWCPARHDTGLVVHAATRGLFSLLLDRSDDPLFSPAAVEKFMHSSVLSDERLLAATRNSSLEDVALWVRRQASKFPTLYQLERRLAFACSRATVDATGEARFDCIPMFDHGGWPRN